jgi:guanylate kinase
MKGKLIILSAPSGSGKTTIVHFLLKQNLNLAFSISATSRKPRSNEKNGVDYYFFSVGDFKKKIENEEFLEWEEVYENQYYGTLKSEVERIRNQGKNVLFDIDVQGGMNLKQRYGEDALALFIQAPSPEILEERLKKRGTDSSTQLMRRIQKSKEEMHYADRFDRVIINDDLETAQAEAEHAIRNFIG